jgi:hypothetical protein
VRPNLTHIQAKYLRVFQEIETVRSSARVSKFLIPFLQHVYNYSNILIDQTINLRISSFNTLAFTRQGIVWDILPFPVNASKLVKRNFYLILKGNPLSLLAFWSPHFTLPYHVLVFFVLLLPLQYETLLDFLSLFLLLRGGRAEGPFAHEEIDSQAS